MSTPYLVTNCRIEKGLPSSSGTIDKEEATLMLVDRVDDLLKRSTLLGIKFSNADECLFMLIMPVVVELFSNERVLGLVFPVVYRAWHRLKVRKRGPQVAEVPVEKKEAVVVDFLICRVEIAKDLEPVTQVVTNPCSELLP